MPAENVHLTKYFNYLYISCEDKSVLKTIYDQLVYFRRNFRIDETGQSQIVVQKELLATLVNSNIVTYYGLLDKIIKILENLNVSYVIDEEEYEIPCDLSAIDGIKFKEGQRECIDVILNNYNGIIVAPTGWGKTFLFSIIANIYPKSTIDIIVPRLSSLKGIYQRMNAEFKGQVGVLSGSENRINRITIISINSLHKNDFSRRADIVLVDEVQNYGTPARIALLSKYKPKKVFGFSADPKTRMDNAFPALEAICGPIRFQLGYGQAVESGSVVPIIIQWIPIDSGTPVEHYFSSFVKRKRFGIWTNVYRNAKIAEIAKLVPEDEQCLIIVETVEHLLYLMQLLPDFIPCYATTSNRFTRNRELSKGFTEAEKIIKSHGGRKELERKFRNKEITRVIATKVWSESVDFPELSVLIRADGSASKNMDIQVPGRVSRLSEGKHCGIVYDFIDKFSKVFYRRSYSRFLNYKKAGWTQKGWEYLDERK
jgi:superfamily II DNA or RNA helicase